MNRLKINAINTLTMVNWRRNPPRIAAKPLHGKEASRDMRPKKSHDEKGKGRKSKCTDAKLKTKKVFRSQ